MSEIKDIRGREIIDSRGNPTVEADVLLASGAIGRAAVPSGASTGSREAVELRDGDAKRYLGKGVRKAVGHVNLDLRNALLGMDGTHQAALDARMIELDGTDNKGRLGANALLAVSLAAAHAAAREAGKSLWRHLAVPGVEPVMPLPMMNIINGGRHADNTIDIQEFMIVPYGAPTFQEALRYGAEVFHALKDVLKGAGMATSVGDEGGFAPRLESNEQALEFILKAMKKAGYTEKHCYIALDIAASEMYRKGKGKAPANYEFFKSDKSLHTADEMIDMYEQLAKKYPIISIEDGLGENDWPGWKRMTERLGSTCQIVGDDIFVTNTNLIHKGIAEKIANSVLIKVNQIGTLTETIEAVEMAKRAGYTNVISHRSGETEDTTIADLAVALNTGQIKTGSASRTDRIAKYNQLLRIEEKLGSSAVFPGRKAYRQ